MKWAAEPQSFSVLLHKEKKKKTLTETMVHKAAFAFLALGNI